MIKFLPTILNQLFRVLTSATQEDVAVNVTRHVHPSNPSIHPTINVMKTCPNFKTSSFFFLLES